MLTLPAQSTQSESSAHSKKEQTITPKNLHKINLKIYSYKEEMKEEEMSVVLANRRKISKLHVAVQVVNSILKYTN